MGLGLLVARLVTPIVWRVPGHGARKLAGFARAEEGSRVDLLHAAQLATDTPRRALYLRHALDEARHARMFARRAAELRDAEGRAPLAPPTADTDQLFRRLGEAGFLAFVHRGERRGRRQFELYRDHFARRGDAKTAALFAAILVDEARHERYTRAELVALVGGEPAARRALRRAAMWEAWRMWRRAGRAIAQVVYAACMAIVYLTAVPLAALAAALGKRPPRGLRAAVPEAAPAPAREDARR